LTGAGPTIVYSLCLLTSLVCAAMLSRAYLRTRQALLLWSAACFWFLALNNMMVVLDMVVFPRVDFSLARQVTHLVAVSVLLVGFIWESDR
jgi:hypothetical protein